MSVKDRDSKKFSSGNEFALALPSSKTPLSASRLFGSVKNRTDVRRGVEKPLISSTSISYNS